MSSANYLPSSLLKPDDPRGIKMMHVTSNSNVITEGLKTGKQMANEGIEFGRSVKHPYSFLRPPYKNPDMVLDWKSSFNPNSINQKDKIIIVVNVDPDKVFIYPQEARTYTGSSCSQVHAVMLKEYFEICDKINIMKCHKVIDEKLYTLKFNRFDLRQYMYICDPIRNRNSMYGISESCNIFQNAGPSYNSEVLIDMPCIFPEWFVEVIDNR